MFSLFLFFLFWKSTFGPHICLNTKIPVVQQVADGRQDRVPQLKYRQGMALFPAK